ncbi:hypothetical protein KFE69_00365 [bacterium SCSIO 12844]|nr:hypothetical protein KFE69_00365 [bacterium SCSIO 12844]
MSIETAKDRISHYDTTSGSLDLSDTDLTTEELGMLIDENIGNLKALTELDLSDNGFKQLPTSIEQLTNMKILNLSGNYLISNLEKTLKLLANLPNLTTLDLSLNLLDTIPENIENLNNLSTLRLGGNYLHIRNVPSSILNLVDPDDFDYVYEFDEEEEEEDDEEEEVNIEKIEIFLQELSIDKNHQIMPIIYKNSIVQVCIYKACTSSLYSSNPELLKQGLSYLLQQLLEADKETILQEIEINVLSTDPGKKYDCSTPIADLCTQKYILSLKKDGKLIPKGLLEKLSISDYITHNITNLHLSDTDVIEQAQGLINSIFLKESWQNESNKLKIKHSNDQSSTTKYIEFAFNQVSTDSADAMAKVICQTNAYGELSRDVNGYYSIDDEKLAGIVDQYTYKVLHETTPMQRLLNTTYDQILEMSKKYNYDFYDNTISLLKKCSKKEDFIAMIQRECNISQNNTVEDIKPKIDKLLKTLDQELSDWKSGNSEIMDYSNTPSHCFFQTENDSNNKRNRGELEADNDDTNGGHSSKRYCHDEVHSNQSPCI